MKALEKHYLCECKNSVLISTAQICIFISNTWSNAVFNGNLENSKTTISNRVFLMHLIS